MSVVWVLGAAGGVGSIVCQNLSKQGWKVVGSGRTEILRSIFGLDKIINGTIEFLDEKITPNKPQDTIKKGIVMIPEDRRKQGLVLTQNTKSNISITDLIIVSKNQIINSLDTSKFENIDEYVVYLNIRRKKP